MSDGDGRVHSDEVAVVATCVGILETALARRVGLQRDELCASIGLTGSVTTRAFVIQHLRSFQTQRQKGFSRIDIRNPGLLADFLRTMINLVQGSERQVDESASHPPAGIARPRRGGVRARQGGGHPNRRNSPKTRGRR